MLDTNVIIHSFKKNNNIVERLDKMTEIFVPVEVVGELYYGAYRSSDPVRHIAQIRSFLRNCNIVSANADTADIYGNTKAILMKKGKPIPENDIWIATLAIQYQLPLFTMDNHFTEIDNISLFK